MLMSICIGNSGVFAGLIKRVDSFIAKGINLHEFLLLQSFQLNDASLVGNLSKNKNFIVFYLCGTKPTTKAGRNSIKKAYKNVLHMFKPSALPISLSNTVSNNLYFEFIRLGSILCSHWHLCKLAMPYIQPLNLLVSLE